jgi:two-component system chemotaxis sensor kinase CheA
MNDLEIIKEFLVESYENLDQLDRDLVVLEKDPTDRPRLASIFRTFHTIKGTCGFLRFAKLEAVTHVGENLLSRLRDGRLLLNAEITSALLALVDAVRAMLACIEATGQDGAEAYTALITQLTRLAGGSEPGACHAFAAPQAPGLASDQPGAAKACHPSSPGASSQPAAPNPPAAEASHRQPTAGKVGDILIKRNLVRPEDLDRALNQQESGDPRRIGEILAELGAVKMEDVLEVLQAQADSRTSGVSDQNIRVDVALLDKLMTLVGELVLARNRLLQLTATQKDNTFVSTCRRLNVITTELQEGIMKTRMQPIATIWNKFPRVARDLALSCGKQVQIELEGEETELDKAVIAAIKDPLTHLVRNAVDHGIEAPAVRQAQGKPVEGRLSLRAFHEGGQVHIEIRDDGGGIDVAHIKKKARERGLITRDQAERMSDRELLHLIFLPGFSTADKITNLSGRGVGMDVVKTNVEKIGGIIDVQSQPGQGTTIKIKIPLTLAIIPALIVTTGGDCYAIPQFSLLELVRLEGKQACRSIEKIHTTPVYRLRGELIPLVYLDRELKVEGARFTDHGQAVHIAVLQADNRPFGLVVDHIMGTEEIVVKPLTKRLKRIPLFAGATMRGDGGVALILDVPGLAQCAGVISEVRNRAEAEKDPKPVEPNQVRQTLLLLGLGPEHRLAIPLPQVTRLEKFIASAVEKTAQQEVVQYRGQILPLIRLATLLNGEVPSAPPGQDLLQVVVYSERGRSVGLVVDRILDTVETVVELRDSGKRPGILGSAVIQERVTDLLDLPSILQVAQARVPELVAAAAEKD